MGGRWLSVFAPVNRTKPFYWGCCCCSKLVVVRGRVESSVGRSGGGRPNGSERSTRAGCWLVCKKFSLVKALGTADRSRRRCRVKISRP